MEYRKIFLNDKCPPDKDKKLLYFLYTLFSRNLSPSEKLTILENDFGIIQTKEINEMCWFADFIRQEAMVKGKKIGKAEGKAEGKTEGKAEGKAEEREQSISFMIDLMRSSNASDQKIDQALSHYYHLSPEEAKQKRDAF